MVLEAPHPISYLLRSVSVRLGNWPFFLSFCLSPSLSLCLCLYLLTVLTLSHFHSLTLMSICLVSVSLSLFHSLSSAFPGAACGGVLLLGMILFCCARKRSQQVRPLFSLSSFLSLNFFLTFLSCCGAASGEEQGGRSRVCPHVRKSYVLQH
jgi:hypothetical protein